MFGKIYRGKIRRLEKSLKKANNILSGVIDERDSLQNIVCVKTKDFANTEQAKRLIEMEANKKAANAVIDIIREAVNNRLFYENKNRMWVDVVEFMEFVNGLANYYWDNTGWDGKCFFECSTFKL